METHINNCIFCDIINNRTPSEKIYEDDYVTCIKDINPASTHHYLILPNKHIRNAKELQPEDASIYERILSTVDIIAEKQGLDLAVTRTGFHWPPFNTIHHLHLHVISPVCNIGLLKRFMFKPNSYWFVSTEYVKSYLKDKNNPSTSS
ncbi:adenosine 5'-monophosphoramidase HINT3-like [Bombus pascuorum]|uniref:adenosine 5'-monophosphoramidase HINT3-like n=1 Tax=Bombus pascuorum TaxID=65598 RepID=UPI00213C11E2|nr:adenosine 5'-monophosphoramidase HINT3-like [Bombus pascuorum]